MSHAEILILNTLLRQGKTLVQTEVRDIVYTYLAQHEIMKKMEKVIHDMVKESEK